MPAALRSSPPGCIPALCVSSCPGELERSCLRSSSTPSRNGTCERQAHPPMPDHAGISICATPFGRDHRRQPMRAGREIAACLRGRNRKSLFSPAAGRTLHIRFRSTPVHAAGNPCTSASRSFHTPRIPAGIIYPIQPILIGKEYKTRMYQASSASAWLAQYVQKGQGGFFVFTGPGTGQRHRRSGTRQEP